MASWRRSGSTVLLLVTFCFLINTLGIAADEQSLRDRIVNSLGQSLDFGQDGPKGSTKAPVVTTVPTKKPTVAPTFKKTPVPISTTSPTKKPTKLHTLQPTKKPVAQTTSPSKKATSAPTKKATPAPTTKTTKAPVVTTAPSKKATKSPAATATPTSKKTKSLVATLSPSKKSTKSPISGGSRAKTTSPTKSLKEALTISLDETASPVTSSPHAEVAVTLAPTANEATQSPQAGIADLHTVSPTPGQDATEAPTANEVTSSPTVGSDTTETPVPTEVDVTPSPTAGSADAETAAPTTESEITLSPTGGSAEAETPAPTDGEQVDTPTPSIEGDATASPTTDGQHEGETLSPSNSLETISPTPSEERNETTASPSELGEATSAPTVADGTQAPSPQAGFTQSPTGSGVDAVSNATLSPTDSGQEGGNMPLPVDDGNATRSPVITEKEGTVAPTAADSSSTRSPTLPEVQGNITLKSQILNAIGPQAEPAGFNWTAATETQLWLAKVAGITSRSAATSVLLALQRLCFGTGSAVLSEMLAGEAVINNVAIPGLLSNETALDELSKMRDSEQYRVLREKLEFASASCASAVRALEHLVDVCHKVAEGNFSTQVCNSLVNPALLELGQYDTTTEQADTTVSRIVLASIQGFVGLVLLVLHPIPPSFGGTRFGFIVATGYIWAYAAFMTAWYLFNLSEADTWLQSTWWRSYYSTYLIGLGGWIIFMLLTVMLYSTMIRHRWFLGLWSGLAMGGVFGIQVNTLGMWRLGYDNGLQPYLTLACCIGGGAGLWAIILIIWAVVQPTVAAIQHWAIIWIGAYFLVKMIGILIGNYPNEFDMSLPMLWETYVYIACMWVLALLVFVFQAFVYGITAPLPKNPARGFPPDPPRKSTRALAAFGEEEKSPLLPPVGSAADARNLSRQQEVSEFGGVRLLRPDNENRRLYV